MTALSESGPHPTLQVARGLLADCLRIARGLLADCSRIARGLLAVRIADRIADRITCGLLAGYLRITCGFKYLKLSIGLRIGLRIGYVADHCRIGGKNPPDCWHIRTLTDRMIGQSVSVNMMQIRSDCGLRIPIRNPTSNAPPSGQLDPARSRFALCPFTWCRPV